MKKILICDDSDFIRMVLRDILSVKYKIVEADTGKKTWDVYEKEKPDMVFLDIIMPEGEEEGFTILQKIMKKDPDAKVIMITAVGQDRMIEDCKKTGASGYIIKPFDEKEILNTVEKYI